MSDLYGGLETGGTTCVAAVAQPDGKIVARHELATGEPEPTLGEIVAFFAEHEIRGLGIGTFGPVDLDPASATWGHITTTPKLNWRGVSLAPRLREALGVPVVLDNDVGAAAYGEYAFGAGRGRRSLAYLTVGTGIGAGFVLEGQTWHGAVQPEVGHIRLPRASGDEYAGRCPVHGDCWEGLASAPAIAERFGTSPVELSDDHVAWHYETEYLAAGILAISLIVSPHRFILGGGVGRRPGMLERVRERVVALNDGYLVGPLAADGIGDYLVAPELGADAGVLGAVALAREGISGGGASVSGAWV